MDKVPTRDDFETQINANFSALIDGVAHADLTLFEIVKGKETSGAESFSLLFRGPAAQPLSQQTYEMENVALGKIAIFIVPVERTPDGFVYEAVFNNFIP